MPPSKPQFVRVTKLILLDKQKVFGYFIPVGRCICTSPSAETRPCVYLHTACDKNTKVKVKSSMAKYNRLIKGNYMYCVSFN